VPTFSVIGKLDDTIGLLGYIVVKSKVNSFLLTFGLTLLYFYDSETIQ
jgi:hypothetical protein